MYLVLFSVYQHTHGGAGKEVRHVHPFVQLYMTMYICILRLECSSQKFSDTIGHFMDSKSHSSLYNYRIHPSGSYLLRFLEMRKDACFSRGCCKAGEWLVTACGCGALAGRVLRI